MKVNISENGKIEIDRLQFDIKSSINFIFKYIPTGDIKGLDHILVTDLPLNTKFHDHNALGAYFKRQDNREANIELYIRNLFGHLKSAESLRQMLPIQEVGLAQTIFHEIGHHVREIRTHGITKKKSEKFAESYAKSTLNRYILDNAKAINSCFEHMKSIANDKRLSFETIVNMEEGWKRSYKEALESTRKGANGKGGQSYNLLSKKKIKR